MLLTVTGLSKRYEQSQEDVVRGLDLAVDVGESVAIVGPSGCGKSTLLNCIGGLDRPSTGSITLDGIDVVAAHRDRLAALRATSIGFIFQDHHLLPQLSALENVLLPTLALPTRPSRAQSDAAARDLLNRVGLSGKEARRPSQLSGGERQRVAVARSLINRPKLLLADEPTGALDERTAESLAVLLLELNRTNNTAMIVVTHSLALARRMGRTLVMRDGQLHTMAAAAGT